MLYCHPASVNSHPRGLALYIRDNTINLTQPTSAVFEQRIAALEGGAAALPAS